jgi:hypothetical protein
MDYLKHFLSRFTATPYPSNAMTESDKPILNEDGYPDFAPDDPEN